MASSQGQSSNNSNERESGQVTIKVKTATYEEMGSASKKRKIDASTLSPQELESLRMNDPFMYYSTPSVRYAAVVRLDDNADVLAANQDQDNNGPNMVTRRSRLSMECHGMLLMEEAILNGMI